ncbi:MAG: hypothetical protein NUV49_03520 [Patescibacteria group bacterium]|nr:hypothetical protein [Patescibacteria group bacterium]
MKKMAPKVDVIEVADEGFEGLLNTQVTLFCMNYIYTGLLTGVNKTCVLLEGAKVVYETGELTSSKWKDAQALPGKWYVQLSAIESFGFLKP